MSTRSKAKSNSTQSQDCSGPLPKGGNGIAGASPLGIPAFILGNGPSLPADLSPLRRLFTVGVNRIVRTFNPTVVLWVDSTVYESDSQAIEASGALLVCDRSVAGAGHHGLPLRAGEDARRAIPSVQTLCCSGNTGVCAARWALALGCQPVYLLGMGAEYDGELTDFWGVNERHTPQTISIMQAELEHLLASYPGRVFQLDADSMAAATPFRAIDAEAVRRRIETMLCGRDVSYARPHEGLP